MSSTTQTLNPAPVRVLIVDDSVVIRNLVAHIIDDIPDAEVVGRATDGLAALQKIPLVKPDIIILDLEMPKMNGIEFLRERRRQAISVPVIILSSIARRGARITIEALDLGRSISS